VKVTSATTLLFEVKNGARTVVRRRNNGAAAMSLQWVERSSSEELVERIEEAPETSVQRTLSARGARLPVANTCLHRRSAEVAYFAQAAVVTKNCWDE